MAEKLNIYRNELLLDFCIKESSSSFDEVGVYVDWVEWLKILEISVCNTFNEFNCEFLKFLVN